MFEEGTTIYRFNGTSHNLSRKYLEEAVYELEKNTSSPYDVFDDTNNRLYLARISSNTFLVLDKDVPVNNSIVSQYIIEDTPVTPLNPFGLLFTLKTNTSTHYTLGDVLFTLKYDKQNVTGLSQLHMFKVDINAEACLTKPLLTPNQSYILVRYGPYINSAGVRTIPQEVVVPNGYSNRTLVPWTELAEHRGEISAYLADPSDALKAGLFTVKTPGVYLINGFVQFKSVSPNAVDGMEVNLRINKSSTTFLQTSKIANVKDGGVPFTFCQLITDSDINSADTSILKASGEAYFQINVGYSGGGYAS